MKKTSIEALDGYDIKILAALQEDARISNVALSERVALSPSQCSRRIARLEQAGLLLGYHARIEPAAVGLDVIALVTVSLKEHGEEAVQAFQRAVLDLPEVLECALTTGDADYLLRVAAPDLRSFSQIVMHRLMALPNVGNLRSSIILDQIKPLAGLPLPPPGETREE
ncbi:Lrp/AsnC family transcriptional regulator [Caenispirillum bisanense]|uniref:Transcriptional regulator, AsnC family n=1 Tax=Caenispirillum bisanense TaxID=414052 RepID=A0A286H0C4_9PROT|nr:Lrp/AsnC family transcriptional regulator [Caenispirillum bisanense]SOE01225.1 transcriptional regulator, AsnC family [Caenispirillum bisanense]